MISIKSLLSELLLFIQKCSKFTKRKLKL